MNTHAVPVGGLTVKDTGRMLWLGMGLFLGMAVVWMRLGNPTPVFAANDRFEDYILCTGAVTTNPRVPTDGVWLLDYRAGKLLGTVIDRGTGKIGGWAEVDLVTEFNIPPRQNVHFLMTAGQISMGQAALYVAETTSGKFGVYTMAPRSDGREGVQIKRHDLVMFRQQPPK
jgi:hypothetical protein